MCPRSSTVVGGSQSSFFGRGALAAGFAGAGFGGGALGSVATSVLRSATGGVLAAGAGTTLGGGGSARGALATGDGEAFGAIARAAMPSAAPSAARPTSTTANARRDE